MINNFYNADGLEPAILVTAGVHGNETNSARAVANVDFSTLPYKIHVINCINTSGLAVNKRDFVEPAKSLDLNRCFTDGFEPKTTDDIVNHIKSAIYSENIAVDVHSSDSCRDLVLVGYSPIDLKIKQALNNAGILCVQWTSTKDTIREYARIGVTIELGGMGQVSNSKLHQEAKFIYSVVKVLAEHFSEFTGHDSFVIRNSKQDLLELTAKVEGFLYYLPDYNDVLTETYSKGSVIASIKSNKGELLQEIVAPFDNCIVIEPSERAYVVPGETVVTVVEYTGPAKANPELKTTPKAPKNLSASAELQKYGFDCEREFANFCAEHFDNVVRGVVPENDDPDSVSREGYDDRVEFQMESGYQNHLYGDIRTPYFNVDVKGSPKHKIASISGLIPIDKLNSLLEHGISQKEAYRRLMYDNILETDVDYFASYGTIGVSILQRNDVLGMLSEKGLDINGIPVKGWVLEAKDEKTGEPKIETLGGKDYLRVYLPCEQWADKTSFNKCFLTCQDLIDCYAK